MPYRSEKQRRLLHAKEPRIAARWDKKYGSQIRPKRKRGPFQRPIRSTRARNFQRPIRPTRARPQFQRPIRATRARLPFQRPVRATRARSLQRPVRQTRARLPVQKSVRR